MTPRTIHRFMFCIAVFVLIGVPELILVRHDIISIKGAAFTDVLLIILGAIWIADAGETI